MCVFFFFFCVNIFYSIFVFILIFIYLNFLLSSRHVNMDNCFWAERCVAVRLLLLEMLVCSDLQAGLECIQSYTRRCMNQEQRVHFNQLYHGTGEVIHELCEDTKYQEGT